MRLLRKLLFVHATLWRKDAAYRLSVLLGPAALAGLALAGILWPWSGKIGDGGQTVPPGWAMPQGAEKYWSNENGAPRAVPPSRPLPPVTAEGQIMGFGAGWTGYIGPLEIGAVDVNLLPGSLGDLLIDGPTLDMDAIMAKGPAGRTYAGVGTTYLVVKDAGLYKISARLERPVAPQANCLTRLVFSGHRIFSSINIKLENDVFRTFDADQFNLSAGLYSIAMAFSCWQGHEMVGSAKMTLMISHPGETALEPARTDEIVRPANPTK